MNDSQYLFIWSRNHKQMGILSGNADKLLEIKCQSKKLLGATVKGMPTYLGARDGMFRNSAKVLMVKSEEKSPPLDLL